jgi:hypothetical protein
MACGELRLQVLRLHHLHSRHAVARRKFDLNQARGPRGKNFSC